MIPIVGLHLDLARGLRTMMNRREFNQIAVGVTVTLNLSAFSLFADTLSAPAVSGEGASPRRVGVRRNGAYWGHK